MIIALLQPDEKMKKLQDESNFTEMMYLQEEMKTAPFGDVWNEYLARENVPQIILQKLKSMSRKYW